MDQISDSSNPFGCKANIIICEFNLVEVANYNSTAQDPILYIYVKDSKGRAKSIPFTIHFQNFYYDPEFIEYDENTFSDLGLTFLSENPVVYGKLRGTE